MSFSPGRRLALAVAVMAGACGDGEASVPVQLSDYAAQAQDAICDWSVRCQHVPDRDTCERLLVPRDYDTRRVEDAIAADRLAYDAQAAGTCLEATRQAHCLVLPYTDAACARVFSGKLDAGSACTARFECEGGAECEAPQCTGQCCTGSCGAPPPPIEPPALAEIGERCDSHFDCVVEAYCETDGRCTASPEMEGEPCLFGCARGDLFCDLSDLTCRRHAGRGESCDASGQSAPPCDLAWSYCDGVCRDRPGAGEVCDDADRRCVAGLRCDQGLGTCAPRGDTGAACTASAQCVDVCVDQMCADYMTCSP